MDPSNWICLKRAAVLALAAAASLSAALLAAPPAHAQQIGGGVNVPGEWWLGEGLKQGDFFSYQLCHVNYKECTYFEVDFWISGTTQVGSEEKWVAQAVVYDGGRIYKGDMELGRIVAEPTGGSDNLVTYRSAVKSSVSWLSSFATSYGGEGGEGPKAFSMPSWGKIANIGGEQVMPQEAETVDVPAGIFDAIRVGWKTGGAHSHIWIVDEFPFPVRASTWTHVAEGQPPQEYALTLLEYEEGVQQDPFAGIVPSQAREAALGCPDNAKLPFKFVKKSTENFAYGLEVGYKPEEPKQGCDVEWLLKFKNKYDETEFLNQVQYDILVVDDGRNLPPIRNLAADDNRQFLYSPSGLAERTMPVREPPGANNYLITVYGMAPEYAVPDPTRTPTDFLLIRINVLPNEAAADARPQPPAPAAPPDGGGEIRIPSWIKTNAGMWAGEMIDDGTFVGGLQYLIREGIMVVPETRQGAGTGDGQIPGWVRTNAGWWSDGTIGDDVFVAGIQYLIKNGMIRIS